MKRLSKEKKLTNKELKKIVEEIVDYHMEIIADVLWGIKQDVLSQIEYEELDYEELIQSLFEIIGDLVAEEIKRRI